LGQADNVHDIIVVSGSCVVGSWLVDLIHAVASVSPSSVVHRADDDELFPDIGRMGGGKRVLLVTALNRRLMKIVAEGRAKALAVQDDPVDSVRFIRASNGSDFLEALREQTRIASSNYVLADNPYVHVIARGTADTAHAVIKSVIMFLCAEVETSDSDDLLIRFGGPLNASWSLERALEERGQNYVRLDHLANEVSVEEAMVVRGSLSPLVAGVFNHNISDVVWARTVFLAGDSPGSVAPQITDLTGSARILYYGPYLYLPPGSWNVRISFRVSASVNDTPFRITVWCDNEPIAKAWFRPSGGGVYEGSFGMRHVAPDQSIEIHFMNDEGVIEGHVSFGEMTFTLASR
jgi:hypothetical protein